VRVPERFAVAVGFAIQTVVGAACFVVVLLVAGYPSGEHRGDAGI
jgi:hypothetical protein